MNAAAVVVGDEFHQIFTHSCGSTAVAEAMPSLVLLLAVVMTEAVAMLRDTIDSVS